MVTRQAPTMSVGVIPSCCIEYGLLVPEQGPALAPATGGGRMVQRPTRYVVSRAQQRRDGLSPLTLRGNPYAALTTRGVCHNESSHRGGLW
jgi:hypothetical protein